MGFGWICPISRRGGTGGRRQAFWDDKTRCLCIVQECADAGPPGKEPAATLAKGLAEGAAEMDWTWF